MDKTIKQFIAPALVAGSVFLSGCTENVETEVYPINASVTSDFIAPKSLQPYIDEYFPSLENNSKVKEIIKAAKDGIIQLNAHELGALVQAITQCSEYGPEGQEQDLPVAFHGLYIIGEDGQIIKIIPRSLTCAQPSYGGYIKELLEEQNGLNAQATLGITGILNPFAAEHQGVYRGIEESASVVPLTFMLTNRGIQMAIPSGVQIEMLTSVQYRDQIIEAFNEYGACSFRQIVFNDSEDQTELSFEVELDGVVWEMRICAYPSPTGTGFPTIESPLDLTGLPDPLEQLILEQLQSSIVEGTIADSGTVLPSQQTGRLVLKANPKGSNVVVYGADGENITYPSVMIFQQDILNEQYSTPLGEIKFRQTVTKTVDTQKVIMYTAGLAGILGAIGTAAVAGKKKFSANEPPIDVEATLATASTLSSTTDIFEFITSLNDLSRSLSNSKNFQKIINALNQIALDDDAIEHKAKIEGLITIAHTYHPSDITKKDSYGNKKVRELLAASIPSTEDSDYFEKVAAYNHMLFKLQKTYQGAFEDIKAISGKEAVINIQEVNLNGNNVEFSSKALSSHIIESMDKASPEAKERAERAGKEIFAIVKTAIESNNTFDTIRKALGSRANILNTSIQGDTVYISYQLSKGPASFGYLLLEINADNQNVETQYFEKLPDDFEPKQSMREKRRERISSQLIEVASETGDIVEKGSDQVAHELADYIGRSFTSSQETLSNLEVLLNSWSNYSSVIDGVTDVIAHNIEQGVIEIIDTTKESNHIDYSSNLAKKIIKYISDSDTPVNREDLTRSAKLYVNSLEEQGLILIEGSIRKYWVVRDQTRVQFAKFKDINGNIQTLIFYTGHEHDDEF